DRWALAPRRARARSVPHAATGARRRAVRDAGDGPVPVWRGSASGRRRHGLRGQECGAGRHPGGAQMSQPMNQKEHFRTAVYQTPCHERTSALNKLNVWHRWKDYTVSDAYFNVALEYAAIRNACAVFDLSPMTKHRITGTHEH